MRESTVDDTYGILFPFIPGFSPNVVLAMIMRVYEITHVQAIPSEISGVQRIIE